MPKAFTILTRSLPFLTRSNTQKFKQQASKIFLSNIIFLQH